MPTYSRHVGQGEFAHIIPGADHLTLPAALKWLSPATNPPIPWHRVIGSSGAISSRGPGTLGAQRQRDALEAEGIEVATGRTGDMRVDLRSYGWFPQPSAAEAPPNANEELEPDDSH